VKVPVIAAGGIADGRGISSGVRAGRGWRADRHRVPALPRIEGERGGAGRNRGARDDSTVIITNLMTGRPARGVANRVMREVGPIFSHAPAFPHAATALVPLRQAAEKLGKVDFSNLWAGQAVQNGAGNAGRRAAPGARSQRPGADEPVAGVKSRQRLAVAAQNRPLLYRRLNLPFEANAI
jgi:nitronate monooxygenase